MLAAISAFRNRLDHPGIAGIVVQGAAKLGDRPGQGILTNHHVGPHRVEQLVLRDDHPSGPGEPDTKLHHFRLDAHDAAIAEKAVQVWGSIPSADAETGGRGEGVQRDSEETWSL
jgi:hypothetical protein